ncbi:N-acetylmuramoyl-L-alanine amidase [Sphingobacterium deserti]|uniref:N-acetylmuramoyl-L-alanine amidase n=1 Tax=Sphingobacterium deserti TaxID=1229276 RepID=A0A0B8T4C2_9SPHI|nr:peptidoglycan recognition family protein [Sphingobacterium deserti]KGE14423.1 N-acetylmuramyl-L-alanine amidase, negative regulator of AmpC, ampd [Sphingobacterium deserti]
MRKFGLFVFFLLCNASLSVFAQERPYIVQKPIIWDAERELLSLEYIKNRHGIENPSVEIVPKMVVVHWTDLLSVNKTIRTFNPVYLPGRPALRKASSLNVSAHFVIGRDGTIFQLLPETTFARHTIGLNYCAIGIENIGSARYPLTDAQLKANTDLVKYLMAKYDIQYVIGHHEYQIFKNTEWWKETDPDYITKKSDPGDEFMGQLRINLGLQGDVFVGQ